MTNCHQLKLLAKDGKKRLTDVANAEGLFRIIQSIPSKKAEPFKQWIAQVAAERLNSFDKLKINAIKDGIYVYTSTIQWNVLCRKYIQFAA